MGREGEGSAFLLVDWESSCMCLFHLVRLLLSKIQNIFASTRECLLKRMTEDHEGVKRRGKLRSEGKE